MSNTTAGLPAPWCRWMAPARNASAVGHDLLHLLGVVAVGRRDGDRAHRREGGAGGAAVVLDLVLEHRDVHLRVAISRREGVLGLDLTGGGRGPGLCWCRSGVIAWHSSGQAPWHFV